jgi:hypothetical protein
VFHIEAIPSLFESESSEDPDEESGYHLSLGTENYQGSQITVVNIDQSNYINVELDIVTTQQALFTNRIVKQRPNALFMAIIGAAAGLIGAMQVVMKRVEHFSTSQIQRMEDERKKWSTYEHKYRLLKS